MAYPTIGSDYHRSMRVPRSCREAFGSDMEREERWNRHWDRAVFWVCAFLCATAIPLIALGVL